MLSDPQTIQWKADGVARIWTLPWKPHEVSLEVGEVPQSVGIENVHEEADFDYLLNFQEKYIRCAAHTPTPVEGITMSLTARQDIDVITMVEDIESQEAIRKVQGGDGIYEHVINDNTLVTIAAAEAAGYADLREHANPKVTGNFETEVPGWEPGQLVTINLPDRGVEGTFLVQRVVITPTWSNPSIWTYQVQYGGRLLGIADFLKALVSAEQKKVMVETAILHKFVYGVDRAIVADEIGAEYKEPPWKVEESLEVVVSGYEQKEFATVGSMLSVSCLGAWPFPQYQTSEDGENWTNWQDIEPSNEAIEIPYPGYIRLKADGKVIAYNWKKPLAETDVVCGFVVVG